MFVLGMCGKRQKRKGQEEMAATPKLSTQVERCTCGYHACHRKWLPTINNSLRGRKPGWPIYNGSSLKDRTSYTASLIFERTAVVYLSVGHLLRETTCKYSTNSFTNFSNYTTPTSRCACTSYWPAYSDITQWEYPKISLQIKTGGGRNLVYKM